MVTVLFFVLSILSNGEQYTSTRSAALPYDLDLDELSPEEIDQAMQLTDDVPVKRGMCRYGFIYQAITRDCIPSLGALRGRGRNGRRGRRGSAAWTWNRV